MEARSALSPMSHRPVDRVRLRGQGIVEYGLILGLSAVFAVIVLVVFGGPLADILAALGDAIDG
jgi:Flp pilus assembly pilin Flp